MLARLNEQQRLGLGGLGLVVLVLVGYMASSCTRQPAQVEIGPEAPQGFYGQPAQALPATVHVAGEVRRPGLYKLDTNCRINDAIEKAGGPTKRADLSRVNLAEKLADGIQIRVPSLDDPSESPTVQRPIDNRAMGLGAFGRTSKPPKSDLAPGSVSLNSASAAELEALPGIGPSTAAKILAYRQAHGGFKSIDELLEVKGIGPKKLEAMRRFLRL